MINFDSLPTNKPSSLPEDGTYYATIETAEMKQGQDPTKPRYLSISLALQDQYGKNCGKVFDIISESDKELVQYKVARFLIALDLAKLGSFELVDLVKIVKGKKLIVDIKKQEAQNGYPEKAVVDVFKGSIYYPLSEASEIFGNSIPESTPVVNTPTDELTIDASDAADVHTADDEEF